MNNTVQYKCKIPPPTSWNGRSYGYEGRRLTSFNYNGKSCTYDYDEQSHRISKTVNGAVTRYIYSGDKLVIEDGPNGKLFFLYDENGQLYGFVKDEKRYFYIKDITGTILGIADESGDILGKYEYSAYGECTVTDNTNNTNNIAEINPFRFKCYYYDAESGMYYCHTRYLVPEWGRWLNFDHCAYLQLANVNEMNLFAYCSNNPIMYSDPEGTRIKWWQIALIAVAVILVIVGATILTGGAAGGALVANGAAAAIANTGAATVVGGAAVATGVVVGGLAVADVLNEIINANVTFSKHDPGMSSRPPVSWTNKDEAVKVYNDCGRDSNKAAEYLMNQFRGEGNWHKGASQEFNKLKKWFDRIIRNFVL